MGRVIVLRHGARTPIADEAWKVQVAQHIGDWKENDLNGALTKMGEAQMCSLGHAIGNELNPTLVHIAWSPDESKRCEDSAQAIVNGLQRVCPRCRIVKLNKYMDDDTATLLLRGHTLLSKPKPKRILDRQKKTTVIEKYFPELHPCANPDKVLKFIDTTFMTTKLHGRLNKGVDAMMQQMKKECNHNPSPMPNSHATEPLLAFVSHLIDKPGSLLTILVCHDNTITNFLTAQGLPTPIIPFGGFVVCGRE